MRLFFHASWTFLAGSLPWSDLVKEPWARHGKKATPQLLQAKEEAARGELEALNDASPGPLRMAGWL